MSLLEREPEHLDPRYHSKRMLHPYGGDGYVGGATVEKVSRLASRVCM